MTQGLLFVNPLETAWIALRAARRETMRREKRREEKTGTSN
jgi:hypothetical protein